MVTAKGGHQQAWKYFNSNFSDWKEKKENSMQKLWDDFNRCIVCLLRVPEGEASKHRAEEIFEILIAKNFLKLISKTKPQIQEAQTSYQTGMSKPQKAHPYILYSKCRKPKTERNLERSQVEGGGMR